MFWKLPSWIHSHTSTKGFIFCINVVERTILEISIDKLVTSTLPFCMLFNQILVNTYIYRTIECGRMLFVSDVQLFSIQVQHLLRNKCHPELVHRYTVMLLYFSVIVWNICTGIIHWHIVSTTTAYYDPLFLYFCVTSKANFCQNLTNISSIESATS